MHRRDFIKTSAAASLLTGTTFSMIKANNIDPFIGNKDFISIFTKFDYSNHPDEYTIVDLLDRGQVELRPYTVESKNLSGIEDEINKHSFHTLLAAATDRNILVYDSMASINEFSLRLVSLLQQGMRRNGHTTGIKRSRITDLYMRKSKVIGPQIYGIKIHGIEDKIWNHVEDFYRKKVYGSYPEGDTNLVFGLDLSSNSFIYGIYKHPYFNKNKKLYEQLNCLASLDYRDIILGSF